MTSDLHRGDRASGRNVTVPLGEMKMLANNKIISLTILGLVIGFVLSMLMSTGATNAFGIVPVGGVVGFIAGWIWQTRSEKVET